MFGGILSVMIKKHLLNKLLRPKSKWQTELDSYNKKFTEPFGEKTAEGESNIILSENLCISVNDRKIRHNANAVVIGGSSMSRTFNFIGAGLLQANCSYAITDPDGILYENFGRYLEYMGYKVRCLDLVHIGKGNRYNPFAYIRCDKDIETLSFALLGAANSSGRQDRDPFLEKSERSLLAALIAYVRYYTTQESHNFSKVIELLHTAEKENEYSAKIHLDDIFEQIERNDPQAFAVKNYKTFCEHTCISPKRIIDSCIERLQAFDLKEIASLTKTDDIDLDTIGDEKTALFVIVPSGDRTFNFLATMLYSQLLQRMDDYCRETAGFSRLVKDSEGRVVKTYRAISEENAAIKKAEAEDFLEKAKNGRILYNEQLERYEILTSEDELIAFRGSRKEAEKEFAYLKNGKVVCNDQYRLPIHTRLIFNDPYKYEIPNMEIRVATIRKLNATITFVLSSVHAIKDIYKEDDWNDIAGLCDTIVYMGGGADRDTCEWIFDKIGKNPDSIIINNQEEMIIHKKKDPSIWVQPTVKIRSSENLRTLPEDKCLVIRRPLNDVYADKKYDYTKHPNWKLVQSLPQRQ